MSSRLENAAERVRRWLLGGRAATIERLERQLQEVETALRDPTTFQPVVLAALRAHAREAPADLAAILAPTLEAHFQQVRSASTPTLHRRWRPLAWLTASALTIAAGAVGPRWLPSAGDLPRPIAMASISPIRVAPAPLAASIEAERAGFGLGGSRQPDADLARAVRARLQHCPELAGAHVRYAVVDGWVWLRGRGTRAGRDAATRALADLGGDVIVINQMIASPAQSVIARR